MVSKRDKLGYTNDGFTAKEKWIPVQKGGQSAPAKCTSFPQMHIPAQAFAFELRNMYNMDHKQIATKK